MILEEKEKLKEWSEMEAEQKRKFNGFSGFCKNAYFSSENAFLTEDKARLQRRSEKESIRRKNE